MPVVLLITNDSASVTLVMAMAEALRVPFADFGLRRISDEMKRYYAGLAESMEAMGEGEVPIGSRDYPEDRMYM